MTALIAMAIATLPNALVAEPFPLDRVRLLPGRDSDGETCERSGLNAC